MKNERKSKSSYGLSRRHLLKSTAIVGAALLSFNTASAPLTSIEDKPSAGTFFKLAQRLTNRPELDPAFATAMYSTMTSHTDHFGIRLAALEKRLAANGAQDVQSFISALPNEDEDRIFALLIIESFYTGNVGRGRQAVVVSYEKALMFQQTLDVTVIPTYIRARPNYWVATPNLDN
ncbi:sugar dehydrogenase complex small subunit [Serratia grimesii]|uniref:sugar dehydrogenase complex small subunit n=1 Tax=Serratia grimesii TaxID=82995 RepID=UPI0039AFCFF3